MLISREYKPSNNDILYHYCDAQAFYSICTTRKMRFSDLHSMNDFMELHWGYYIWEQAASELIDIVGRDLLDEIDNLIHSASMMGLPVGSCYSLSSDVLSQWRAYADDGNGFAIGFSANDLAKLSARPLKILYDQQQQIMEMKAVILALQEIKGSKHENRDSMFREMCFLLASDLSSFKNPAFIEENEVRLIHMLDFIESNNSLKLYDVGGTAFGKKSNGAPIQFKMKENAPVAFIDMNFMDEDGINPIKQVIIGPKNDVLPTAISIFLETTGIFSVHIRNSSASYR